MRSIKKFIVPVDFSETAINAVKFANFLSHDFGNDGVECILLHCVSPETSDVEMNSIENQMDRIINDYLTPNKVTGTAVVAKGNFPDQLPLVQDMYKADVVVMGTNTEDDSHHYTADLIRSVDATVLTVPLSFTDYKMDRMALAIDNKKIDDISRLGILNDFAKWFGVNVHLVLVSPNGQVNSQEENDEILEYYLQTIDYNHHVVVESDITKGLFTYMDENNINMAAILPRTHATNMEPSEGKLTEAMVLKSHKPILVLD